MDLKLPIGIDGYNQSITGEVSMTVTGSRYDHVPLCITKSITNNKKRNLKMKLSNEEKKKLFDAALELGKALTTMCMAKERLTAMSNLSAKLLAIKMDEETIALATSKYEEAYGTAVEKFLFAMGVKDDNDPFRNYLEEQINKASETLKQKIEVVDNQ